MKSDLNFNFGQGVIRFLRKSDEIESFLLFCRVWHVLAIFSEEESKSYYFFRFFSGELSTQLEKSHGP